MALRQYHNLSVSSLFNARLAAVDPEIWSGGGGGKGKLWILRTRGGSCLCKIMSGPPRESATEYIHLEISNFKEYEREQSQRRVHEEYCSQALPVTDLKFDLPMSPRTID